MKEKEVGIDVFRILCCIGVLCYHIMDDVLNFGGGIGQGDIFCSIVLCSWIFSDGGLSIREKRPIRYGLL